MLGAPMTIDLITPIDRKPAAERVASRLMELIQSGNLAAGDKLPHEVELANALQVSRPTASATALPARSIRSMPGVPAAMAKRSASPISAGVRSSCIGSA